MHQVNHLVVTAISIHTSSSNFNNDLPNGTQPRHLCESVFRLMILEHLRNRRSELMLIVQLDDLLQHDITHPQYAIDGLGTDDDGCNQIGLLALRQESNERNESAVLGGQDGLLDRPSASNVHHMVGATAVGESEDLGTPVGGLLVVDEVRCS